MATSHTKNVKSFLANHAKALLLFYLHLLKTKQSHQNRNVSHRFNRALKVQIHQLIVEVHLIDKKIRFQHVKNKLKNRYVCSALYQLLTKMQLKWNVVGTKLMNGVGIGLTSALLVLQQISLKGVTPRSTQTPTLMNLFNPQLSENSRSNHLQWCQDLLQCGNKF